MQESELLNCYPTIGPLSPKTAACQPSGNIQYWSQKQAMSCLPCHLQNIKPAQPGNLAADCTISAYKNAIATNAETLKQLFDNGAPVAELIGWQSSIIDALVTHIWQRLIPASARQSVALVAVGGYGRAELHPRSDIDILILTGKNFTGADEEIGQFVTHLWDLGLDVLLSPI